MSEENFIVEKQLDLYLQVHQIIGIGVVKYSDIIVDDTLDFIEKIKDFGYCVDSILWWERIEVKRAKDSLGHGGPIDPQDSKFFFAETDIYEQFKPTSSQEELINYLLCTKESHPYHDLYPSFTILKL